MRAKPGHFIRKVFRNWWWNGDLTRWIGSTCKTSFNHFTLYGKPSEINSKSSWLLPIISFPGIPQHCLGFSPKSFKVELKLHEKSFKRTTCSVKIPLDSTANTTCICEEMLSQFWLSPLHVFGKAQFPIHFLHDGLHHASLYSMMMLLLSCMGCVMNKREKFGKGCTPTNKKKAVSFWVEVIPLFYLCLYLSMPMF